MTNVENIDDTRFELFGEKKITQHHPENMKISKILSAAICAGHVASYSNIHVVRWAVALTLICHLIGSNMWPARSIYIVQSTASLSENFMGTDT